MHRAAVSVAYLQPGSIFRDQKRTPPSLLGGATQHLRIQRTRVTEVPAGRERDERSYKYIAQSTRHERAIYVHMCVCACVFVRARVYTPPTMTGVGCTWLPEHVLDDDAEFDHPPLKRKQRITFIVSLLLASRSIT